MSFTFGTTQIMSTSVIAFPIREDMTPSPPILTLIGGWTPMSSSGRSHTVSLTIFRSRKRDKDLHSSVAMRTVRLASGSSGQTPPFSPTSPNAAWCGSGLSFSLMQFEFVAPIGVEKSDLFAPVRAENQRGRARGAATPVWLCEGLASREGREEVGTCRRGCRL